MEKLKKSLVFWLLLVVSVVIPAMADAATTQQKKLSWTSTIVDASGNPVGSAIINRIRTFTWNSATSTWVLTSDIVNFRVRTTAYPCASAPDPCQESEILVTKASLIGPGAGTPWERVLCDGVANCGYQEDGNLDAEGTLETPLPQGFFLNLPASFGEDSTMEVLLNDGALGRGRFRRFM
jgi:hypothetical protein